MHRISDGLDELSKLSKNDTIYTVIRKRLKRSQSLGIDAYAILGGAMVRLDVPECRYSAKDRARWGASFRVPVVEPDYLDPPEARLVRALALLVGSDSKKFTHGRM